MRSLARLLVSLTLPTVVACAVMPADPDAPDEGAGTQAPDEVAAAPSSVPSANRLRALVPWPELDRAPTTIGGGEKDAAVIVAVESYDYVPPVPGAVSNGTAWHAYFTRGLGVPVDRVRVLANAEVTKEQIERALDRAASQAQAGGRVWFVFVGHGAPSRDGRDGLLLGADVRQTAHSLESRGVRHSQAVARLERGAAQPIVVLDACFSGRTGSGEAVVPGLQPVRLAGIAKPARALVLSAAKSGQYAGPLPGRARPAFSYLVLGALRGWGDADGDGNVTASETLAYANQAMGAVVKGRQQTAELVGDASHVVARSAGERGPNLAEIQRGLTQGSEIAFNAGGVVLTELPTLQLRDVSQGELQGEVDLGRIDIEKEKAMAAQWVKLQHAKRKVEAARRAGENDPTGTKQEKAWCELADLGDPNPYAAEARKACAQVRSYVEQRRRLVTAVQHDWEKTVVPFMGLPHRSVADKRKVMQAFVNAYGVLEERIEVTAGKTALAMLGRGKVPTFESRGGVSVLPDVPAHRGVAVQGNSGDMVHIAGGSFGRQHISAFEMDRTEVTVAAYAECVRAGRCGTPRTGGYYDWGVASWSRGYYNWGVSGREDHPINGVLAADADAYCSWAGKRLPTEWEWEWAARGRDEGRIYPWGNSKPSCDLTVMDERGDGCGKDRTWPVGSKPKGASRDGLMDMAGNVWEWTAGTEGAERVLRGGGWRNRFALRLRASNRTSSPPSSSGYRVGFRCARTVD
jgi:hypothetical protein